MLSSEPLASSCCAAFVCSDWTPGGTCRRTPDGLGGCSAGAATCGWFMGRKGRFARTFGPHCSFFLSQALHFSPLDQSLPVGRHLTTVRSDAKGYERQPVDLGHVHDPVITHLYSLSSARVTLLHLPLAGTCTLFSRGLLL